MAGAQVRRPRKPFSYTPPNCHPARGWRRIARSFFDIVDIGIAPLPKQEAGPCKPDTRSVTLRKWKFTDPGVGKPV